MSLKLLFLAASFHTHTTIDSIPALHNIHEEDIDTAVATYKGKTVTVKLKSGKTYIYTEKQWGKEMAPGITLALQIDRATALLDRTFTQTEIPPSFPGGPTAWEDYQRKVCSENSRLVRRKGPATVYVQFIVAFDGTVDQVHLIGEAPSGLADLAIRMIKEAPAWEPATQNGRQVTCYARQKIDFQ